MNNRPSQQTRFVRGSYPHFVIDIAARYAVEGVDRSPRDPQTYYYGYILTVDHAKEVSNDRSHDWYQMREWFRKNAPLKISTARQLLDGF